MRPAPAPGSRPDDPASIAGAPPAQPYGADPGEAASEAAEASGADAPPEQVLAVDEHDRRHPARARRRGARRTGTARTAPARRRAPRRATSSSVDLRVAVVGLGEHVVDAEVRQHRRAVGVAAHRHPRSAPDRHEGAAPRRRRRRRTRAATGVGRSGHRTTRPASSARPTSTSATRLDPPARTTPRRRRRASASASSRRFSSSHRTTTSGARATIASRSGSFVPPTVAQRRLLAEPGDRDGGHAPGEQGLGGRRDEADDAHRLAAHARPRGAATCGRAARPSWPGTPPR